MLTQWRGRAYVPGPPAVKAPSARDALPAIERFGAYRGCMFTVLFEVQPRADGWDAYLGYAKQLKPELQAMPGFIENIRYGSLTRDGWLLSVSDWRDEKSLVRWRTHAGHHAVQETARADVFRDYRLRVG